MLHNKELFHFSQNEERFVKSVYKDLLNGLSGDYARMITRRIDAVERQLTEEELADVQNNAINATIQYVQELPVIPNYDIANYIFDNYGESIQKHIASQYNWINRISRIFG